MNEDPPERPPEETACFSFSASPAEAIPEFTVEEEWSARLFERRYRFVEHIAKKDDALVAVHWDEELRREVVIKTQNLSTDNPSRERFLGECRISAGLEHPSIIPVYDILAVPGQIRLTMRKVSGKTLNKWLAAQFPEKTTSNARINRIVQLFIEICRVLEFVHSKGVVHRDIKSSNILVGEAGEVFLIDWGSAPSGDGVLWATPTHMSPEQADGAEGDFRSDLYSLGVTLFECLVGRPPLPVADVKSLRERRRKGEIDTPKPEELAGVPEPLMAICLKAMAPNPKRRYGSARLLANDLANFQAGLAVSAEPDSIAAFAARWVHRHKRRILRLALVAIPFAILSTILYQSLLRDVAKWGGAIFKENFDDDRWERDWEQMRRPGWESRDGGIAYAHRALGWESIFLKQTFSSPLAVEFDCHLASAQPGHPFPTDVSLVWAENGVNPESEDNYTLMQFGAYGNQLAIIAQNSKSDSSSSVTTSVVDFSPHRLTPGKTSRFRIEISGDEISMFVDRQLILKSELQVPLKSGSLGFWAGGMGNKVYDNIAIYSKGVAERVPSTILGDYFLRKGQFHEAEREFARIQDSKLSAPTLQQATFKRGLALWNAGEKDQAQGLWNQLTAPRFLLEAKILILGDLFAQRDFDRFFQEFESTMKQFPIAASKKFQLFWAACANQFPGSLIKKSDALTFLALADSVKNNSLAIDFGRHSLLIALEDYQTIREELGRKTGISLIHLQKMGLHEEVLTRSAQTLGCYSARKNSRLSLEDYEGAKSTAAFGSQWQAEICLNQHGLDETVRRFPSEKLTRRYLLLECKQYEELLNEQPDDPQSRFLALQALGRPQEILDDPSMSLELKARARYSLLLDQYRSGDQAAALKEVLATQSDLDSKVLPHSEMWFEHTLMPAFLLAHSGQQEEAMDRLRAFTSNPRNQFRNEQIPWYFLRYLTGEISAGEFAQQPTRARLEARKTLADALRAELAGDKSTALAAYQSFAALPNHKKDNTIFIQNFIDWRLTELSR